MARIPLLDAASAEGDAARILSGPNGHMGVFRALAHASTNVKPLLKLGASVLAEQKLDARRRELLILLATHLVQGEYEFVQHVDIALGVGATREEVDAIEALQLSAGCFSEADRALLAFGRCVVEDVRVPEAVFQNASAHFSARELVEAIIAMGFYMILARVTEAFEVPVDPIEGMRVLSTAKAPTGDKKA